MAKFFQILAASVGSGLVLGASIRLGEALGDRLKTAELTADAEPAAAPRKSVPVAPAVMSRLDRVEEKLAEARRASQRAGEPEWKAALAGVVARVDRQQTEMETIRRQVTRAANGMESADELAERLRGDLHRQLSEDLDRRLDAVEAGFQANMEAAQKKTAEAMLNSVETRVALRISRLENDIASQTAAVAELRECALQSERSIQRLVGVLERVISPGGTSGAESPKAEGSGLAVVSGRGLR